MFFKNTNFILITMLGFSFQAQADDMACMGGSNASISLINAYKGQCKAGDAILTEKPGAFCDFNKAIAPSEDGKFYCIYTGKERKERLNFDALYDKFEKQHKESK